MSYGSAGAAAVQDRLRVEYAPTDRASCKSCGTGMPKGSVKLGEKVRSPWHDGWDSAPPHPSPALPTAHRTCTAC